MSDVKIKVYKSFEDAAKERPVRTVRKKDDSITAPQTFREKEVEYASVSGRMSDTPKNISDSQRDWRSDFVARHRL